MNRKSASQTLWIATGRPIKQTLKCTLNPATKTKAILSFSNLNFVSKRLRERTAVTYLNFPIPKYSRFDLGKDGSQNPSGMLKGDDFRGSSGSPRDRSNYSHGVKGRDTILSAMILVHSGHPG